MSRLKLEAHNFDTRRVTAMPHLNFQSHTRKKLGDLTLEYDYSAAIYMGTNTVMVDMMILFLVILIGWQIFCRERENGIYPILQTAKRGGVAFISAKLAAYFLMLAILSFLLNALSKLRIRFLIG